MWAIGPITIVKFIVVNNKNISSHIFICWWIKPYIKHHSCTCAYTQNMVVIKFNFTQIGKYIVCGLYERAQIYTIWSICASGNCPFMDK